MLKAKDGPANFVTLHSAYPSARRRIRDVSGAGKETEFEVAGKVAVVSRTRSAQGEMWRRPMSFRIVQGIDAMWNGAVPIPDPLHACAKRCCAGLVCHTSV